MAIPIVVREVVDANAVPACIWIFVSTSHNNVCNYLVQNRFTFVTFRICAEIVRRKGVRAILFWCDFLRSQLNPRLDCYPKICIHREVKRSRTKKQKSLK